MHLAVLAALGCRAESPMAQVPSGPRPFVAVRYQDVVVDQALHGTFDPATGVHLCGDQSRDSFVLAAGETRVFTVKVSGPARLLVGGCAEGREGSPADGSLRVRIALPNFGRREEESVPLRSEWSGRWISPAFANSFEIGRSGESEVEVELKAILPEGARAFVDSLALRSEIPALAVPAARRAILISLDAFREDALGAVGGRTVTPVLDGLLARSERFSPAWSQEISTKTSHASMLSGLPVDLHGVDREERPLRAEISTLAERLSAAGASTGAFMQTAPFFAEKFALDQGFASYRLKAWTVEQELRLAADWASVHRDESSFLFVHLYGAHSDFGVLPYEADGVTRATIAERFGVAGYGCAGEVCASRRLMAINYRALPPLEREPEITRWLYDRGVETLDRQLGQFFDDLVSAGLWDDTLIVLTGDHGEAFGEHGYYLHTTPHEETLRVPLLVKWPESPARAGTLTNRFATALDIAPTLLAHFGLASADLPGHDLAQPPGRGARLMVSKDAVRVDDLKLVLATKEFPRALYDLARDPGEQLNLLPGREADAVRLEEIRRLALASARQRMAVGRSERPIEAQPFTPEERDRLRSLGYL
ncbi:MAG: sulfatase [Thermoanaerobaculia bacterium]